MGAWGVKSFENDAALDWLSEFEDEKRLRMVLIKLLEVYLERNRNEEALIDNDLSSEAIASAEIVAALMGSPSTSEELSTDLLKWLKKKKYDRGLVSLNTDLLNGVLTEAERASWKALSNHEKWIDTLEGLSQHAVKVIDFILEKSELMELWQSSSDYEAWINEVINLKRRCSVKVG
ncbi:DUF4259 domain-containing protein [Paenibacillus sp. OV219]|uniref:DUF4259 domain-containing protein n=1 Tax=Paenibacillus sp. OV219 TaxID=1884377 RepID=UPI0008D335C0|nr:DUF4259 domain-containing protein [Paenibacillus sp. OV219]SEO13068.1 protein of unknown function [Paenibacillus sp. OV219]